MSELSSKSGVLMPFQPIGVEYFTRLFNNEASNIVMCRHATLRMLSLLSIMAIVTIQLWLSVRCINSFSKTAQCLLISFFTIIDPRQTSRNDVVDMLIKNGAELDARDKVRTVLKFLTLKLCKFTGYMT